jgi:hypothetical protein
MTQLLQAASAEDLQRKLALLNADVPPRSAGRTKEHTERFSIVHFLSSLPPSRFAFPLIVEHADRPDCVLSFDGTSIGIELTEAVPENVARASVLRESGLGPSVYFIPRALPGEHTRSTAALRQEIELDRPSPPWMGDAPEREWADAMLYFASAKVEKTRKPGFTLHPVNWLLIYDNWPLPSVQHSKASSIFAVKCSDAGVLATFDRVFVLDSKVLCEVGSVVELHQVSSPRGGS